MDDGENKNWGLACELLFAIILSDGLSTTELKFHLDEEFFFGFFETSGSCGEVPLLLEYPPSHLR